MIYIITDTHYGHPMLVERDIRPIDYEERIDKGLKRLKPEDTLIHLGDFGFKRLPDWSEYPFQKWLCLGNHDKKSPTFYRRMGFDWVGHSMIIKWAGKWILFSHVPQHLGHANHLTAKGWIDINYNIHGHFHNTPHRIKDPLFNDVLTPSHILIAQELHGYAPISLDLIIKKFEGGTWLSNQHSNH